MASDQLVHARMVLQAQMQLKRQGIAAAMRHLEQTEPDLAEYVMESLSLLYKRLLELGSSERKTRRLYLQAQTLVLVSIDSLRKAHLALWVKQMGQTLDQLDPSQEPPDPDSHFRDSEAGA
jgi:hypothetical protein